MAKFWNNLRKHPDNIEKHRITEEEIQFLKNLQHEMNTQDHLSQADPRYWMIRDYDEVYGKNLNNATGIIIYDSTCCETLLRVEYECFNLDSTIEEIIKVLDEKEYELDADTIENIKLAYDNDSLIEALEEIEEYEFSVYEYQEVAVDKGMFLTHEAAIEHLERNDYHYSDKAHTYAQTAWRSKEEKLWNILQTVDFDKIN